MRASLPVKHECREVICLYNQVTGCLEEMIEEREDYFV